MLENYGFILLVSVLSLCGSLYAQETEVAAGTDIACSPQIRSIEDLLSHYDHRSDQFLPILVPDAGLQVFSAGRLTTDFENHAMPADFVDRIATRGIAQSGVMTYPVFVRRDPKTYDHLIEAYDGTLLLTVPREKDYDPDWYVLSRYADRLESKSAEFDRLRTIHDPARIVGWYTLIIPEGSQAFDAIAAALRELEGEDGGARTMSGYGDDTLRFTAMEYGIPGSNPVQVTIGYPTALRGVALDIVGCTNLMEWAWSVLLSTSTAAHADSFSFSLPTVEHLRFLAAYRPDIDTDGDGIPDGVERFLSPERHQQRSQ